MTAVTGADSELFAREARRFAREALARPGTRAQRWARLRAAGLAELTIPAGQGGQGGGGAELAALGLALGAELADVPYLGPACLGGPLLAAAGPGAAAALARAVAGTETVTVLLDRAGGPGRAVLDGDGTLRADGPLLAPDADLATLLLAVAGRAGTPVLAAVAPGAPGVSITALAVADPSRPVSSVRLRGAAAQTLAEGDAVRAGFAAAQRTAWLYLAAENIGAAGHCLDAMLAHARTRHTFGRPLGSYQSVQHRCADRWLELASARILLDACAPEALGGAGPAQVLLSLAAAESAEAAAAAAGDCAALHGALGFTAEHEAHRYLRRARGTAAFLGSPAWHRERAAALLGYAAPAAP